MTLPASRLAGHARRSVRAALGVFFAVLVLPAGKARAQSDGLHADFTTSFGSFSCMLDFTNAPRTVANFVGLAAAQRAWLEVPTGRVLTSPFYNGITFHRVVPGFVIQAGSPNGQGTDGPGYSVRDEFTPVLRHDGFGVLSMANSGPDSNGSQFFITLAATPSLNDVHSVFGRLTSGSNVVHAIGQAARNSNDKPLADVVIQNVSIRAVGAAAEAFSVQSQGLPVVTNATLSISASATNLSLSFSNRLHADNRVYRSTNLTAWSGSESGVEVSAPVSNQVFVARTATNEFFRAVQINYSDGRPIPKTLPGRTMVLVFNNGVGTITNVFTNSVSGTYTYVPTSGSPGSGAITNYNWIVTPYRGRLSPIQFVGLVPMVLHLNATNPAAGVFSGTAYSTTQFAVSGSFTISP